MKGRIGSRRDKFIIPNIGRISIGMISPNGNYPVSLDYFRPVTNNKKYEDMFLAALGEKPNTIQIAFMSDDINEVCKETRELKDKSGKVYCETDNEVYVIYNNGKKIVYDIDKIMEKNESVEAFEAKLVEISESKIGFRRRLSLVFVIPEIKGVIGSWKLVTYAEQTSIDSIIAVYDGVKELAGTCRMIPFDLRVEKHTRTTSGDKRTYPVITLVSNTSLSNMKVLQTFTTNENFEILSDAKIMELKSGQDDQFTDNK